MKLNNVTFNVLLLFNFCLCLLGYSFQFYLSKILKGTIFTPSTTTESLSKYSKVNVACGPRIPIKIQQQMTSVCCRQRIGLAIKTSGAASCSCAIVRYDLYRNNRNSGGHSLLLYGAGKGKILMFFYVVFCDSPLIPGRLTKHSCLKMSLSLAHSINQLIN